MWAMEYSPKLFSLYESGDKVPSSKDANNANEALLKKYGKFERKNVRIGQPNDQRPPLSIFLMASVLEAQNKKLLQEAKGLDDVVKVSSLCSSYLSHSLSSNSITQFLILWGVLLDLEWYYWKLGRKEGVQRCAEASQSIHDQGILLRHALKSARLHSYVIHEEWCHCVDVQVKVAWSLGGLASRFCTRKVFFFFMWFVEIWFIPSYEQRKIM